MAANKDRGLEFRLLGPLEACDDGHTLALGGQKRRALLALLLLHANEVVSNDRLIEELWGEDPPQAAATALHGHISRLRKLLGGNGERLLTRPPGYVLQLEAGQLDLHRFESLREEARVAWAQGDLAGASAKLRDALALWRGPALADVAYERFARVEAERLEELRLATVEERIDIDLALGRHADLVSDLERLVAEHPLREGFRAQLMLALYRSGRQAEALQVYQQTRRVLLEELGIDPSQRLRELEQAILRQDASLGLPVGPVPEAGAEPAARPRPKHLRLVPIVAVCAVGAAAAVGLLLGLRGGEAAAAYRPGTVMVDAKTGKPTAFLPPSQLAAPTAPVYAGGHVWLLNVDPASFVEIDPVSGKELQHFAVPNGVGEGRAARPFDVGRHFLWAAAGDDLVQIDLRLGMEVDRFHLDKLTRAQGRAQGVAVGEGGLIWVGRDVGLGQVIALDPRTGRIKHRYDNRLHHVDLASDDGIVWASDSAGVDVIDPSTDHVATVQDIHSVDPFFGQTSAPSAVAAGGGFGWTTDPAKGLLYKIDRGGRIVESYRTGLGASGVSFSDGAVWVRNEDVGTVSRVDPLTGEHRVYRFGHPVAAEVAGGGVVLAALEPGRTIEDRLDALPRNSLRFFSKTGPLGQANELGLDWDTVARQIGFATCANLLRYPDEPAPKGSRLRPEVAAAMPTITRDRRTYTFTIRPGYRFSPPVGEPVTAQTFRYSIERAFSPRLEAALAGIAPLPAPYGISDIEGERAFRHGKTRHISGVRATGNHLSITLVKPSASFIYRLRFAANCPVPRGTPAIPGAGNRRVGANAWSIPSAGPYYVAEWRDGKYAILRRNPYYRGPRPHRLAAIGLREGVDGAVALERMKQGGWDGIASSGQTGSSFSDHMLDPGEPLAEQYGNAPAGGLQYLPVRLLETNYVVLNSVRGPFTDPTVRKAVAYAIDRGAIATVDRQLPSDQLLPPMAAGYHSRRLYPLRPDRAKASSLMHGRRRTAVLAYWGPDPTSRQEARVLKADLGAIGIRVELRPFPNGGKWVAALEAAARGGRPIDLQVGGTFGDPEASSFLTDVVPVTIPATWLGPDVKRKFERMNRLSGNAREAAAVALADWLDERNLSLIPYGNHVQGELFAPSVGCRVFPPAAAGVDLAALCRQSP